MEIPYLRFVKITEAPGSSTVDIAGIGLDADMVGAANATTNVISHNQRPTRSAGVMIDSGSPEEQARKIADYLEENNLI